MFSEECVSHSVHVVGKGVIVSLVPVPMTLRGGEGVGISVPGPMSLPGGRVSRRKGIPTSLSHQ